MTLYEAPQGGETTLQQVEGLHLMEAWPAPQPASGTVDLAAELACAVTLRRARATSSRIQATTTRLMGGLEAISTQK